MQDVQSEANPAPVPLAWVVGEPQPGSDIVQRAQQALDRAHAVLLDLLRELEAAYEPFGAAAA